MARVHGSQAAQEVAFRLLLSVAMVVPNPAFLCLLHRLIFRFLGRPLVMRLRVPVLPGPRLCPPRTLTGNV